MRGDGMGFTAAGMKGATSSDGQLRPTPVVKGTQEIWVKDRGCVTLLGALVPKTPHQTLNSDMSSAKVAASPYKYN